MTADCGATLALLLVVMSGVPLGRWACRRDPGELRRTCLSGPRGFADTSERSEVEAVRPLGEPPVGPRSPGRTEIEPLMAVELIRTHKEND